MVGNSEVMSELFLFIFKYEALYQKFSVMSQIKDEKSRYQIKI
jgi:hypothetical protein